MATSSDIEVVRAVFAAFAARDVDDVLAYADAAIEFIAVTAAERVGRFL